MSEKKQDFNSEESQSLGVVQPSLFISHGTPMLALQEPDDDAFARALSDLGQRLVQRGLPRVIVVVSAHRSTRDETVEVQLSDTCYAFHDFMGFPPALYELDYRPAGSPAWSERMVGLLQAAGMKVKIRHDGALDHGVWVPLKLLFPEAQIPVVQLSFPFPAQPQWTLKMGQALASLRAEGVLLIGSGGAVHNLGALEWHSKHGLAHTRAAEFEKWVMEKLHQKDVQSLLMFEDAGPQAEWAHPTTEHFYPLFFTLGAALPGDQARPFYYGIQYASLSLLSFSLESDSSV